MCYTEMTNGMSQIFHTEDIRQDNFITFLHVKVITDLAPQVAEANQGGPGTIKMNSASLSLKETY